MTPSMTKKHFDALAAALAVAAPHKVGPFDDHVDRPSSSYGFGKVHWMRSGSLADGGGQMWCGHVLKVRTHSVNKYTTSRASVTCKKCLYAEARTVRAAIAQAKGESNG